MDNYKKLIVFLFLLFFFCLPTEADMLDDYGLRNNDPEMIGKIVSIMRRNIEDNRVCLAFKIIIKNLGEMPKKIILRPTGDFGCCVTRILFLAYSENEWMPLGYATKIDVTSFSISGKSSGFIEFERYIDDDEIEYLSLPLKVFIGGRKISPTEWGKSIEIDFKIKPWNQPQKKE